MRADSTRSADDLVWGFGLGCGGVAEVLLEPLAPDQSAARASRLWQVAETRPAIVVEVQAVHAGRAGRFLSDRASAIHAT